MISRYFVYKVQLIIIPIQFLLSLPLYNIHTFKVFNFFINTSMPQLVLKLYSDHQKFFLFYINVSSRYVYLHIFCVFSQQAANIYICTSEEQEMPLGMCTQCIQYSRPIGRLNIFNHREARERMRRENEAIHSPRENNTALPTAV